MAKSVCEKVKPFYAMQVLARATELEQQGRNIVHLSVGQPDFPTPECVKEAAIKAIHDNKSGYTPSNGILPLREAISEYYADEYGANVSPDRIIITQGSSPGLMMLLSTVCEQGDTVMTTGPAYACYDGMINFAGAKSIRVPTTEENGFQMTPEDAKKYAQPNTRLIIVNSPSNPAGTVVSKDDLAQLAQIGPMLLSDEIYHGLTYEGKAASALEVTDNCLVADGFSKRYAMTGWRLGWVVMPQSMVNLVNTVQQNFFICAPTFAQWAGISAIKEAGADVVRMREEYNRRREVIIAGLKKLGFGIKSSPAGAFYVLADARFLGNDSLKLAFDILEKAHVGTAPGIDFGPEAEGYLRFSYANSVENIEEAMSRLKKYIDNK